jgi:hypothetical protein
MIKIYRECLPEVKTLFLQTVVKLEHYSKSLSLPVSISVIIVELQWACSLLSQIIGLDNDKFVVKVMLGFLLIFFLSGQSVRVNFDEFIAENIHQ